MFLQIIVMAILISGMILILFLRRKRLLRIVSGIIPHTELGRSLIALFNGVGIMCTAFVLGVFGKAQLLIIALTLEISGLLFALLALAFYPVSFKFATMIDEDAKTIFEDLYKPTEAVLGDNVTKLVKTTLEEKLIPTILESSTGHAKMILYSFVLFYYYAYIFTLFGIISLLIGVGTNI